MADNADLATEILENRLEGALAKSRLPQVMATSPECEDCGHDIPEARRKAAPWAATCIECQGIREIKARQRR